MKQIIILALITILILPVAFAATCQELEGMQCGGCCKTPLQAENTNTCCQPQSCVERIQFSETFPDVGEAVVERFPDKTYGVFYGEKHETFGRTAFTRAFNLGKNVYEFSIKGKAYRFTADEDACGISLEKQESEGDCTADLSCDEYFIFIPTDKQRQPWQSESSFQGFAAAQFLFFQDISKFKFRNAGVIIAPFDFVEKECAVEGVAALRGNPLGPEKVKNCADKYAQKLGITYEKAVGLINSKKGEGYATFGGKVAISTMGSFSDGPNDITVAAHEIAHTYLLCDEYTKEFYDGQNQYLKQAGLRGCRNELAEQCIPTPEIPDCLGSSPVFREFSEPHVHIVPDMQPVCQGVRKTSIMGIPAPNMCGYDVTGGYDAIG